MSTKIDTREISVVIQGPVRYTRSGVNLTRLCAESVKRLLPDAEVILSTWAVSDVSGVAFDTLILSNDPGSLPRPNHRDSNVNRQIVSTFNGLLKANKPYSLKIRSDCVLVHSGFLDVHSPARRGLGFDVFQQPITASSVYFKNPQKAPFLFHAGDIFQFGLTDDLLNLWDIPLASDEYISNWERHFKKPWVNFTWGSFFRYIEEQYVWLSCLKKNGIEVDIHYPWEMTKGLINISERSILGNFTIVDNDELGLMVPWNILFYGIAKIYSADEVRYLSQLYLNGSDTEISDRLQKIIRSQRIRTPLLGMARLLNRYGIF